MKKMLRQEIALPFGLLTLLFFKTWGGSLLSDTTPLGIYLPTSFGLLVVVTSAIFSVVRHSDALAIKLGEPFGTLILTLSVISLEVVMISSVMLTGEPNPPMARDTMFAVVMLVTNGLVGFTLLFGGWRYHTQSFNLDGVKSYLVAIIPLALLCLVLPNFTEGGSVGSLSSAMSWMLIIISILLYGVFLLIQTRSHSHFFVDSDQEDYEESHGPLQSNTYHTLLLVAYLVVVILLAKTLAIPINYGVHVMEAPAALGGFIVACIVLAPEAVGALKAAFNNQLQRAMNLYFGSVLATIALTVPSVLFIGAMMDQEVRLGLAPADLVLLVTTLMVCKVTFSSGRTNVLHGATHLVLFVVYLFLMFEHQ
ncbi:calcium:proton antiporter [Vibrio cholerae]|nr:calcium:proton antiporter [Vibrio cholerae]EIN5960653.1 calcium:proton antiporter [Vibrio cholerae]EKF9856940.1 calcium:proton antiporter [Vibrio cholerae]GIA38053.1 calcium:proton antiporter [Vibrio cholerae]